MRSIGENVEGPRPTGMGVFALFLWVFAGRY